MVYILLIVALCLVALVGLVATTRLVGSKGRVARGDRRRQLEISHQDDQSTGFLASEESKPKTAGPRDHATDTFDSEPRAEPPVSVEDLGQTPLDPVTTVSPSFRDKLGKARHGLTSALGALTGRQLDDQVWDELEEIMILADMGLPTTAKLLQAVRSQLGTTRATDVDAVLPVLRSEMVQQLSSNGPSLSQRGEPAIWLFVGVNGVGKTTTIGKLARREAVLGRRVVLAAGDTFRAAAAEQLESWANRAQVGFVRGAAGADPGSVIFDAVEHASASGADLVLADTAGRLHTKSNLMEELRKVKRVAQKDAGTVTEVLLVIDATTGQNGLVQARQFTEAVEVTGIVLTKLDGSAKGGIVFAIENELGIPVKLVGLGEGVDDLVDFDPHEFVDALFA